MRSRNASLALTGMASAGAGRRAQPLRGAGTKGAQKPHPLWPDGKRLLSRAAPDRGAEVTRPESQQRRTRPPKVTLGQAQASSETGRRGKTGDQAASKGPPTSGRRKEQRPPKQGGPGGECNGRVTGKPEVQLTVAEAAHHGYRKIGRLEHTGQKRAMARAPRGAR